MPDLRDGESTEMKGSAAKPYVLKNTGGVYSCSCPAWRNQSVAIERRTCKHIRKLRGDAHGVRRTTSGPGAKSGRSMTRTTLSRRSPELLVCLQCRDCGRCDQRGVGLCTANSSRSASPLKYPEAVVRLGSVVLRSAGGVKFSTGLISPCRCDRSPG